MTKTYSEFDRSFLKISEILDSFSKSHILQDFFTNVAKSWFYANLMKNFFDGLTPDHTINLTPEKISKIKTKYTLLQKEIEITFSSYFQSTNIDEQYYEDFKLNLKKNFPEVLKMISKIEKEFEYNNLEDYFNKKRQELERAGKPESDLNVNLATIAIEAYVSKEKKFPMGKDEEKKALTYFFEDVLRPSSYEEIKNLKRDSKKILKRQRSFQLGFEHRLYNRWKEPIDLLESFIQISLEFGKRKKDTFGKGKKTITEPKHVALLKIHARAVQISNEILTLLKSGYADGANARWRSVHELAVISFFLEHNDRKVSERYLEHNIMKKYKDATDYQRYYVKLGYPPLSVEELRILKTEHDLRIRRYGKEFEYKSGFEWIPCNILPNRNFRALEEHVKIDKFHPFYNMSANAVHGGPMGFHRLGLLQGQQHRLLLVGPTNYGLADPINSTAISLLHVTGNLLLLEPNFQNFVQIQIMDNYVKEIGPKAVKIQQTIESEEKSKTITK